MKLSWHGVGAIQLVKKGLSGLGWLVWHVLLCELYSACTAGLRFESCYVYVNVNVYVYVYWISSVELGHGMGSGCVLLGF